MLLQRFVRARALAMCVLGFMGFVSFETHAGEFPVSGKLEFVRGSGKPQAQLNSFSAPVVGDYYLVRIVNGEGGAPVTSASVWLNGTRLLSAKDFKKGIAFFEIPVTLQLQNSLSVELVGKPGSGLRAEVIGIDNQNPTIDASIAPAANDAGWHNVDATVTFTCADDLSGIESCTDAVTVQTEGADQVVSGTAVDKAGNQAELQVSISLDKTAPQASTSVSPLPNSAGWHREAVTITYQCEDALSGIATCPEQSLVTEEGADQQVSGKVVDVAGNSREILSTVQLDLTSPEIRASVTPSANSAGWHNAPVSVSYECSDSLSGVASCPDSERLAGDGPNQAISGSTVDHAGNTASTEVTVHIDQTSPEISFLSPADGSLISEAQPELQLLLSDNLALDDDSLVVTAAGNATAGCEIAGNIARCTLATPLAADAEIPLNASVRDLAGNRAETSITTAIDSDGDAVADYADLCADTASTLTANADGCAPSQLDSDSDGVNDAEEIAAGSDPEDSNSFPPVLIETFVASPTNIGIKGQQVELRWQITGAQNITLTSDGGEAAAEVLESQGTLAVNPQITTSYTLTATGPAGETSQSVLVKLDLSPPPELWTTPSIPVQEQIATSLAVADDGSAYIGAFDGNFYKINSSGLVEWILENAGVVMGKAAIADNRIFVGANVSGSGRQDKDGRVYALSSDKALLWSFNSEGAVVAGPLLNADAGTVYIATYNGNVYALNTRSGEQLWHFLLPDEQRITSKPALTGQSLILHTENNEIFALDVGVQVGTDRVIWHRSLE